MTRKYALSNYVQLQVYCLIISGSAVANNCHREQQFVKVKHGRYNGVNPCVEDCLTINIGFDLKLDVQHS